MSSRGKASNIHRDAKAGYIDRLDEELSISPKRVNEKNADGFTPLYYACVANKLEAVKFLVSKGADPRWKDENGISILHHTCKAANFKIANLLIDEYGVNEPNK